MLGQEVEGEESEEELEVDSVMAAVTHAKEVLRGLCVHEMITDSAQMCPKVVADKVRWYCIDFYLLSI